MIRVTQGHEQGVGLEVFLKAFICLSRDNQDQFILYCSPKHLKATLKHLFLPWTLADGILQIAGANLIVKDSGEEPTPTSSALHKAIEDTRKDDILLTLPSSKDQIQSKNGNKTFKGHTDLFRRLYPDNDILMTFVSPHLNVVLLSDHVALSEVEFELSKLDLNRVFETINEGFKGILKIQNVFVSGINPHCGEGGIISSFDHDFQESLNSAASNFKNLQIRGLYPGDTTLFNHLSKQSLFVFAFHDQGLAPFKFMNGLTGINLTLGMPYKRVSVDHGTAFDLFGKNQAGYQGMLYLLNEVLLWH